MKTIGYEDITDVLLSIADPNTGGAISSVPGVSSPKINGATSVYNVEAEGGSGIAGWSTNVNWYASDYDTVARGNGSIYLPDGTSITISSGNTGNMSAVTYIYYDRDLGSVQTTTSAQASVGENKILLCVASPTSSGKDAEFQAFGTNKQSTFITADNIAANTITGNEIQANSIDTAQLKSGAITTAKIDAGAVTAGKIDVTQLSDIDPDLGTITAGTLKGTTIIAGSETGAAIKLYPYSSTTGRLEYYYGGNSVGYIAGGSVNGGGAIAVNASIFGMASGTMVAGGKLRIPVGTDLYD